MLGIGTFSNAIFTEMRHLSKFNIYLPNMKKSFLGVAVTEGIEIVHSIYKKASIWTIMLS